MTEDVKKEFVLTKSVYKEVFMAFYKPLCLFARKILSCEEDAEDMVHNVFLAIWERKMSFIDKSHLKVYLYRAVYNQSITYIRRQKFTTRLEDHEEGNEMDENNYLQNRIETEVFVEIMQAIDRLPEHRREIFKLSYIDGLKFGSSRTIGYCRGNSTVATCESPQAITILFKRYVSFLPVGILSCKC